MTAMSLAEDNVDNMAKLYDACKLCEIKLE